jgi:hypothetical protein
MMSSNSGRKSAKRPPRPSQGTQHGATEGVLRFNYPGYGGDRLQEISWDQFFKTFDERDLVFLSQEHMKAGNQSNFFHFDRPSSGADESKGSQSKSHSKSK